MSRPMLRSRGGVKTNGEVEGGVKTNVEVEGRCQYQC